jgi:hypothetical protein
VEAGLTEGRHPAATAALRVLKWVGLALLVVLLVLAGLALWPASTSSLGSAP